MAAGPGPRGLELKRPTNVVSHETASSLYLLVTGYGLPLEGWDLGKGTVWPPEFSTGWRLPLHRTARSWDRSSVLTSPPPPASSVITRDPSQFPEAWLDKELRPLPCPFPVPHKIKSQVTHYPKITDPLGNISVSNRNIDLILAPWGWLLPGAGI